MQQHVNGERFVLNGGRINYKDFFEQVAKEFGKKPPEKLANTWMKELIWRMEYLRSLISGCEPLITKETARLSGNNHEYDNNKIKALLSYEFHTIEDSVHWVCKELEKQSAVHNLL